MNEAAIAATREDAAAIARKHVEFARDRILMGAERQGFMMDDDERYATAVHEAGHVAVGLAVENGDPIPRLRSTSRMLTGAKRFLPCMRVTSNSRMAWTCNGSRAARLVFRVLSWRT